MPDALTRRILLVEDEESLVVTLCDRLTSEGYEVEVAGDGESAVRMAGGSIFDLIVLDVALPRKNGFDVCRDVRQSGSHTPILMLTARGQVFDKVLGLKLGADDYLTKPFDTMELLARIEALLRRAGGVVSPSVDAYAFGGVRMDFRKAQATRDGVPIDLSALELRLLRYFIEHRGAVVSREELLDRVWGYEATPVTRTVDVHVAALRQKLERNPSRPEFFVTVHGVGYKFLG